MGIEQQITEVNQHLERVTIRVRGKKLSFRGTFPPKPGDGQVPKHYELSSGCSATPVGLKLAKAKAQEIDSLLVREKFEWNLFLKIKPEPAQTTEDWIQRFEANHWEKVPQDPSKLNSFHKDYRLKFNHLPAHKPLTVDLLKSIILEKTQPGTRSRKGFAMAYRLLAEFAGLPEARELADLERGYSSTKSVVPRIKLQSILFTELRIWMETWELGQSFEATYTKARQLVRHHLKCLSPEQQTWVEALLKEDAQEIAPAQKTARSQTVDMLGKMLTQEDWQVLADTAAQGMAVRVLQMGQPDGVSAKAS